MTAELQELKQYLENKRNDCVLSADIQFGELTVDVAPTQIYDFVEFLKLKSDCKFNNCLHVNEPKCAVKLSLEKGEIATSRYKNYLNMLEQDEESFRINRYEK